MQNKEEPQFDQADGQPDKQPKYTGGTYGRMQSGIDGMGAKPRNTTPKPEDNNKYDVSVGGFVLEKDENQSPREEETTAQADTTFRPVDKQATPPTQTLRPEEAGQRQAPPPKIHKIGFPRWLKIVSLIVLIIVVISAVYLLFFYKSTLDVSVSQQEAKIYIDNKLISAGANNIRPGNYGLKIEKDGFVPYQKNIQVSYFKKTSISVVLKEIPSPKLIYSGNSNYLAYNQELDLYIFFVPEEAAFYRVEANKIDEQRNNPIQTTPKYIKNLVDVIWNPDRLTAIFKIKNENAALAGTPFYSPRVPPGEIITFLYDFGRYDLLNQEAIVWGIGFGDIEFTPDGKQVAYFYEPGDGEKSLVIANKDNSNRNRIADLRAFVKPNISWSPDLKNIVLTNKSTDYSTNKISVFNLLDKTMTPVTDFGNNLDARFDMTGKKIIYGTYSNDPDFSNYSLLSTMDKDGQNKKELKARAYVKQADFLNEESILILAEKEKNNYGLISIELLSDKKTDYVMAEEIIGPTSLEYIQSKNSIIYIEKNKSYLLFLTTNEYE